MRILFIGDIYGNPGRTILAENIKRIKEENGINLVIANAENCSHGHGLSYKNYKELMSLGINALTMGNHTWGNREIYDFVEEANIAIPANYPDAPGKKFLTLNYNGKKVLIINLLGRVYMNNMMLDCPFKAAQKIIKENPSDYYIIDMHAEATSEKVSMGLYFDGIASAVVGTHTHVQTADERVLPKGTLYITDVGMTGPLDGVIGVKADVILDKFTKGTILPSEVAQGKRQLNAVILDLGPKPSIKRIKIVDELSR